MADGDLCTVAQVKELLGGTVPSSADALLARLVSACSASVKEALDDPLLEADYDERYDGTGAQQLVLRHRNVTHVQAVENNGLPVPKFQGTGMGWLLDGRRIVLRGYRFCGGTAAVRVRYTAGLALEDVPADIVDAVIDTAALAYKQRGDRLDIASETLNGQTIAYVQKEMRARAAHLVERRKDRVPA